MKKLLYLILLVLLFACKESVEHRRHLLTRSWMGKPIYCPPDSSFESIRPDSTVFYRIKRTTYTIVSYVNEADSCEKDVWKLQEWRSFLDEVNRTKKEDISCLLYFKPQDRQSLYKQLINSDFQFSICIDEEDLLQKLNHFPQEAEFRTFLLDHRHRVVAIGNPATNPEVRKRYLQLIQGIS